MELQLDFFKSGYVCARTKKPEAVTVSDQVQDKPGVLDRGWWNSRHCNGLEGSVTSVRPEGEAIPCSRSPILILVGTWNGLSDVH